MTSSAQPDPAARVPEALGASEPFVAFQERLSRAARVDRPVLIVGERGTGKELAAARLHYLSARWREPLIALNCAALSPALIESELFGYEAGAFTGALKRRLGRFEAADRGTLFLDEIGNIPLEVQEKILRAVEYGLFERVGSAEAVRVDVRIVGATNADLPALARSGEFKQDLLDRLSFEVLHLPPLRQRRDDILLLANHFAARMAFEMDRGEMPQFSDEAVETLLGHAWPGNVRELKNVVERAVYRAEGALIRDIDFDPFRPPDNLTSWLHGPESKPPAETAPGPEPRKGLAEAVRELEVEMITAALKEARYNQRQAASLLGLTYHQFRGLYRKHDLAARRG